MHGLFFIVLFQYYVPAAIVGYALYFCYTKIQATNLKDEDILNLWKSFFTPTKK